MTMTNNEADHLLGQMIEDLATEGDEGVGWLSFWARMPADDKLLMAQRGAPRVLQLAAERGIAAGHAVFPRVAALYAALDRENRRSDT